jgi:hypothetical protein
MTTRSTHDKLGAIRAVRPQVITQGGGAIVGAEVDMRGFDSCQFVCDFGDIDEIGASPVGTAQLALLFETAPDDGTGSAGAFVAVADAEIDTDETVGSGIIAITTDTAIVRAGIIANDRFARLTMTPTGLTNGGPVAAVAVMGHAHLTPTS